MSGDSTNGAAARHVGQSVPRLEDRRMITGHGRYVDNVVLPNMLHAAFVRSSVARGRITRIDTDAARALPGVVAVFTGADLNAAAGPLHATMYAGAPMPPLRPLAHGDVRFVGEAVAIVVATSRPVAFDACDLVEVDVDPQPAVVRLTDALSDRELVHPELGTNVATRVDADDEAAWAALCAGAAHVVTRTFTQARATNVPMEPRGIIAAWDPWAPQLQVWSSTQNAHEVRAACSRVTGVPEHHVRVVSGDVGGGFGMKIFLTPEEGCVVLAAHRLGRAVKWIETRRENILAAGHAREETGTVSVALDNDGLVLGLRADVLEDVGAFPMGGSSSSIGSVRGGLPGPYRVPAVFFRGHSVYTNTCGRTAYRGPWMMETTLREQIFDHAARVAGIDPLELRRRNSLRLDEQPYTSATGSVLKNISPAVTLEQAAELIDYDGFRTLQAAARAEGRHLGIGVAAYTEPTGMGAGILGTEQATLRIEPSGGVSIFMGTGSTGNSLETTIAQVVADHLGCRLDDVMFHQGDTASSAWGHGSGGSRAAVQAGGAAAAASDQLRERLVRVAADMLEAAPEDLVTEGGIVSVVGTPGRSLTFAEVARKVYTQPQTLAPDQPQGLEVLVRYRPPEARTWSNATHACTVEVDVETGAVRLLRYVVSEDCGRIINPMVVDGQIAGGVVQGISGALFEHLVYDDDGTPLTSTLMDYLVPSAAEMPNIECGHVVTPSDVPGGYKGMGEGGAIASPAAVANAVADALSPFTDAVTTFPLSPNALFALLAAGR